MLLHPGADRPARGRQTIALRGEHVEQLPPPGDQRDELLMRLVRQGPHLGADALGEEREHGGIDGIGLREPAYRFSEVADLPGFTTATGTWATASAVTTAVS